MKTNRKPQRAFGAAFVATDGPYVSAWTIHGTAYGVREAVGRQWCKDDPANGWKAAKKDGAQVVKIEIRIV